MTSHNQKAYRALSLTHLLTDPQDKIPELLRPSAETFMLGKTVSHDAADRPVIYAHGLAAWAHQVIHVSGLEYPVALPSVDVERLRQAIAA